MLDAHQLLWTEIAARISLLIFAGMPSLAMLAACNQ